MEISNSFSKKSYGSTTGKVVIIVAVIIVLGGFIWTTVYTNYNQNTVQSSEEELTPKIEEKLNTNSNIVKNQSAEEELLKYQSPNFNFSFDYPAKYGVAKPQTKVNGQESEMPMPETITFENNPNIKIELSTGVGGYYLFLGMEGFKGIGGEFTKTKNGFTAQINPFKKEGKFLVTGVVSMFNLDTLLFPSYQTDIFGEGLLITAGNLNQSESEVYREEIRDILESAIYDIKEEVLPDEFLKEW